MSNTERLEQKNRQLRKELHLQEERMSLIRRIAKESDDPLEVCKDVVASSVDSAEQRRRGEWIAKEFALEGQGEVDYQKLFRTLCHVVINGIDE